MKTARAVAEEAIMTPPRIASYQHGDSLSLRDIVTDVAAAIARDREAVREACAKKSDGIRCQSCCGLNEGPDTIREVDIKGT